MAAICADVSVHSASISAAVYELAVANLAGMGHTVYVCHLRVSINETDDYYCVVTQAASMILLFAGVFPHVLHRRYLIRHPLRTRLSYTATIPGHGPAGHLSPGRGPSARERQSRVRPSLLIVLPPCEPNHSSHLLRPPVSARSPPRPSVALVATAQPAAVAIPPR